MSTMVILTTTRDINVTAIANNKSRTYKDHTAHQYSNKTGKHSHASKVWKGNGGVSNKWDREQTSLSSRESRDGPMGGRGASWVGSNRKFSPNGLRSTRGFYWLQSASSSWSRNASRKKMKRGRPRHCRWRCRGLKWGNMVEVWGHLERWGTHKLTS